MFGLKAVNDKVYNKLVADFEHVLKEEMPKLEAELDSVRRENLRLVIEAEHLRNRELQSLKNFEKVISVLDSEDAKLSLARRIVFTMETHTMDELKSIIVTRKRLLANNSQSKRKE